MLSADRIIAPVDFSEPSLLAVRKALRIAEAPSAVHVVHVLPPLEQASPGVIWGEVTDDSRREHATQTLRKWLVDHGFEDVQWSVKTGDPGTAIVDYAKAINADLIVVPSHGRTGLSRLLLGSVAARVVRFAPCPVLVLRRLDSRQD